MTITGIIILLCGTFITFGAARSLSSGKTEEREELPPIKKARNPARFYLYVFACMAGGIAMSLLGVVLLALQASKYWQTGF